MRVDMAAGAARAQSGLRDSSYVVGLNDQV
jgi:hypothetical protein